MKRRAVVILGTAAIFLAFLGGQIARNESVLAHGRPVYLELAPVDPRSLIQGDYMALDYAVARKLAETLPEDGPRRGEVQVYLAANGVAALEPETSVPAANPTIQLAYRRTANGVQIGTDAFYFEEGTSDRYDEARYGEFRVAASGEALLVGLVDESLHPLGR
jgi:uncharacterized membrane-anchored protein